MITPEDRAFFDSFALFAGYATMLMLAAVGLLTMLALVCKLCNRLIWLAASVVASMRTLDQYRKWVRREQQAKN